MGCAVLAPNGTSDHVHLLVSVPATVSVAALVKQVKGVSSHFVNEVIMPEGEFRWQGSYGAFSVGADGVDALVQYVKDQKTHHAEETVRPEWEETGGEGPVRGVATSRDRMSDDRAGG